MSRLATALTIACLAAACDSTTTEPIPPYQGEESGTPAPATESEGADPVTSSESGSVDTSSGGVGTSTGDAPSTFGEGGTLPDFCPPGLEPALEMGHGDIDFRPIDSGVAQLVQGHQGGYHIVIGLRGVGLDLADWGSGHMRATIGGEVLADYDTIVVMQCDEDGGQFSEALWLNLIFEAQPPMLLGQTTFVEVDFTDASDVVVSASGTFEISEDIVHL